MSFAAGTFFSGTSNNPQHLMLAAPSQGVPNNLLPLIIYPQVVPEGTEPSTYRDDYSKMALAKEQIKRVPLPQADPITGGEGAVTEMWHPIARQENDLP